MRTLFTTKQYEKDVKLAKKRGLNIQKLVDIVRLLANGETLPIANRDHPLHSNLEGYRECHIQPDWLLIYKKGEDGSLCFLELVRTGSHSDLF